MTTIEQAYSSLVSLGVRKKYNVIPEFCIAPRTALFNKKIDLVWVEERDEVEKNGSLRYWRIVAAFEIEGYNVPLDRLRMHASQFDNLRQDAGDVYPSFVVLYTRAHHRRNPDWGSNMKDVDQCIKQRLQLSSADMEKGVRVISSNDPSWLDTINQQIK